MFESCLSFGKYGQWVAAITGALTVFVSGSLISWPAAVLPKFNDGTAGFTLTTDEQSWIVTMLYVGCVMSPLPCSYLMDKIGRKTILHIATFIGIVTWLILLTSKSIVLLYLARVLSGIHCGIEYTVVSNFIAESVDPEVRGRLGTLMIIMFGGGALFMSLISFCGYNTIAGICLVNSTVLFICFMFLPETPYFYLMKGKRVEAEKSVAWLKGTCSPEDLNHVEVAIKEQMTNPASYIDIFRDNASLKAFGMVSVLKFVAASSSYVLLMTYAPLIIPSSWVSSQQSYIVLCLSWVITAIVTSMFMDRFSRKAVMVVSCTGAVSGLTAISIWYYLRDFTSLDVEPTNWLPLVLATSVGAFETVGLVNIPNIYKGEVFPINVKSKASAMSCIVALIFEGINNYFYFSLNNHIGLYFNFVKSAISALIGLFFSWLVLIETKNKSLEEIQDILNNRRRVNVDQHMNVDRLCSDEQNVEI